MRGLRWNDGVQHGGCEEGQMNRKESTADQWFLTKEFSIDEKMTIKK